MAGATNYLWTTVIIMGGLLPLRLYARSDSKSTDHPLLIPLALLVGVLVGWTNENMAPVAVLAAVVLLVYWRVIGRRVPAWSVALLAGMVMGLLAMLWATGQPPSDDRSRTGGIGFVVLRRSLGITHAMLINGTFVLLVILLAIAIVVRYQRGDRSNRLMLPSFAYFSTSLLAAYVMALSPLFPTRAWMGVTVLAVTAVACGLAQVNLRVPPLDQLVRLVLAAGMLLFAVQFAYAYARDLRPLGIATRQRLELIEAQKREGRMDVSVPPLPVSSRYAASFELDDLSPDNPNHSFNRELARYCGVRSVLMTSTPSR